MSSSDSTATEPIGPVRASAARLRSARRLLRRKERITSGTFLAEGPQVVREALAAGRATEVFVADSARQRHDEFVSAAAAAGVPVRLATDDQVAELGDTVTSPGLVAVCRRADVSLTEALAGTPQLVVALAQGRDPGNAGTVIRSASAFGADAVLLSAGSVELHNPKTVRASVGSVFQLPISAGDPLADQIALGRSRGMQVLAADGTGSDDLDELAAAGALAGPTLWVFGNEAWGLPAADRELVDRVVAVPIHPRVESLNLATAAAVCLHATAAAQRARRASGRTPF